jgi:LPS sulfotransferase NodH
MQNRTRMRYILHSLPRTGSTTLARVLNCHPELGCVVEPFHPKRYDGFFNQLALEEGSLESAVAMIARRWAGLKHVFDGANGWPFNRRPALNEQLLFLADKVILLKRRDCVSRYLSDHIAKHLGFWIGSREEFLTRLQRVQVPALDPLDVRRRIEFDLETMENRDRLVERAGIEAQTIWYEDLFRDDGYIAREDLDRITSFLGVRPFSPQEFATEIVAASEPLVYRWASSHAAIANYNELKAAVEEVWNKAAEMTGDFSRRR